MEEIKVGEYFRCKKYGRINKYLDSFYAGRDFNVICEPNLTLVYHSKEDFISSIKPSKNILDLIEEKDILCIKDNVYDEIYISEVFKDYEEELCVVVYECDEIRKIEEYVENNKIELISILTHEMYEKNCYKVGDIE